MEEMQIWQLLATQIIGFSIFFGKILANSSTHFVENLYPHNFSKL